VLSRVWEVIGPSLSIFGKAAGEKASLAALQLSKSYNWACCAIAG